jgi:aspartyl protease family protein
MSPRSFAPTVLFVCGVAFFAALIILPGKADDSDMVEVGSAPASDSVGEGAQVASAVTESTTTDRPETRASYGVAAIRREKDGHYWARANVDGQFIRVMVDTGASIVALTREDARKLGFDPDGLDYRWSVRTAGGDVMGAYVTLESMKIGGVKVENVEAMVLQEGLTQSLLGMSFLGQLYSYEFRGDSLILRQ